MPLPTTEQLENASLDAQILEKFINDPVDAPNPGQADGTVTNREGETFDNLAKIIQTILATDLDAQRFFVPLPTTGGTANAITTTVEPTIPVIAGGAKQVFAFTVLTANTSSVVTLLIPGVGGGVGRPLRTNRNTALAVGALIPGKIALVRYDAAAAAYELLYPEAQLGKTLDVDLGGSANAITMAAQPGQAVVGTDQVYRGILGGSNANDDVFIAGPATGPFAGVSTRALLPNGQKVPKRFLKTGSTLEVRAKGANWEVLSPVGHAATPLIYGTTTSLNGILTVTIPYEAVLDVDNPGRGTLLVFKTQGPKGPEGGSIALVRPDGSAALEAIPFLDNDGNALATGHWVGGETLYVAKVGAFWRLLVPVDRTSVLLSNMNASLDFDMPPAGAPIMLQHPTKERWLFTNSAILYDDENKASDQDRHQALFFDGADANSGGILKSAYAVHIYADRAMEGGKWHEVGNLASQYLGSGLYDGISHSTNEWGARFGDASKGVSEVYPVGHPSAGKLIREVYGFGHVMIKLIPGTAYITMEVQDHFSGVWSTSANLLGTTVVNATPMRGRQADIYAEYEIYRSPQNAPVRAGMVSVHHQVIPGVGKKLTQVHRVGRGVGYKEGVSEIVEGDVLTWAGGGSGEVVWIPGYDATGAWTGTRAGTMYLKNVVGPALADGTELFEGAVLKAKATGPADFQFAGQQSLFGAMTATNANFAKVPNFPEFRIDGKNGVDQPYGMTFTDGNTEVERNWWLKGVTSGVQVRVSHVPPVNGATGTWGGSDRAGHIFFYEKKVGDGNFETGEDLVRVDGEDGAVIGTPVAKVGALQFAGNLPKESRFQTWHSNTLDADGDVLIYEVVTYRMIGGVMTEVAASLEMPAGVADPPETYYVDCRPDGTRKYYPVWDATSSQTGDGDPADPLPYEGKYTGIHVWRIRRGKPV